MPPRKASQPSGPGSKYGSAFHGPPRANVTFLDCDALTLQEAIALVANDGDCMMFSRTSDAGAVHIRILSEGLVEKWYPDSPEALEGVLRGVIGALKDG
jgi:hypothetical protein